MKRNDFNWDKIVDEAFSNDRCHVFSEHYNVRKRKLERSITMKRTLRKGRIMAIAVSVAAAAALVPVSIYAYNKFTASINKTAKYRNTISVQTPVAEENAAYMDYDFGWTPEGFSYGVKYGKPGYRTEDGETIYPILYRLPADKSFDIDLLNSYDCENYTTGDKSIMINHRNAANEYDRDAWVYFNDTRYLLELIVTDGISNEDLKKTIENITLKPSDEKNFSEHLWWEKDENEEKLAQEYLDSVTYPVEEGDRIILQIGDTGVFECDNCTITLNSAELTDSMEGIHTDACGWEKDFSDITDENGNVAENIRSYIKLGDGIDTIDEIVYQDNVPYHILKINATFTNTADETNEIGICPEILVFNDGIPNTRKNQKNGLYYEDSIYGDRGGFFSLDTAPEVKGGRNSVTLGAGQSTDVQIAFLVPDDYTDEMFINFVRYGNSYSQSLKEGYPIFDVSK